MIQNGREPTEYDDKMFDLVMDLVYNALKFKMDLLGFRFLLEAGQEDGLDYREAWRALQATLYPDEAERLPPLELVAPSGKSTAFARPKVPEKRKGGLPPRRSGRAGDGAPEE